MGERVVVTGLGAITPLGNDVKSTWRGMTEGRSGYGPITLFDPAPYAIKIAGEIRNFDPLDWVERKDARRMDRNVQFAVAASRQAVDDANLTIDSSNAESIGAIIGSAIGGIRMTVDQQKLFE
jgi:3-oxoacyl-[acyl-carrier-protein] synthase II